MYLKHELYGADKGTLRFKDLMSTLDLVRAVLRSDDTALADLRSQRGVGADAVGELRRFYELKVYKGDEPGWRWLRRAAPTLNPTDSSSQATPDRMLY